MDDASQSAVDWRDLAEAIPGGVAVQSGETFVYVSEAFATAVGVEAGDLAGDRWRTLFDRSEVTRLERVAVERVRTNGRWEGTVRTGGRTDETAVELTLSATDGGVVVWTIRPEDRPDPGHERARDLERYETIIETVGDGVYALDEDLRFTIVNEALCEMWGTSREELLGTCVRDLFEDDQEVAIADALRQRVVEGDTGTGTVGATIQTPDGERRVEARYRLHPEPDGEYRGSVGVIRDVTERDERERELERQRDALATLDRISELLLESVRESIQTASREAVERTVCERLAESDLYQFAWVGERAFDGDGIVPRTTAGEDHGYLEAVTITDDRSETGRGPAGRAMRTGEVQVANVDDPAFEPWREAASERGFESVAAVPLHHGETVYGVLVVYATREDAFGEREGAGFDILGRTVGFVIHAARSRELLFADSIVELEFSVADADSTLVDAAADLDCEFSLDGYVASGDRWILYLAVDGTPPAAATETVSAESRIERARVVSEVGGGGRIELVVTESSLFHILDGVGVTVRSGTADADGLDLTIEAPASAEVRDVVDHVQDVYPNADLVARHERDREVTTVGRPGGLLDELTDRQREVLEASYRAGYFTWPRESTAEDVARSLDIAAPTLHGHLRKAEAAVFSALLDVE